MTEGLSDFVSVNNDLASIDYTLSDNRNYDTNGNIFGFDINLCLTLELLQLVLTNHS